MAEPRHFITGEELTGDELRALVGRAEQLRSTGSSRTALPLRGRSVALIFEKPSTRTRVSLEVGVSQLGGHPVVLRGDELQLTRGESVRDTAMVLSRYVALIAVRSGDHEAVVELAEFSSAPVINALTPLHHPCQALADLLTLQQRFGMVKGLRLAYVGDGNNVCNSLMLLGAAAGVQVAVATPPELRPDEAIVARAGSSVELGDDPLAAAAGAHALYTDVWVSMGDEGDAAKRRKLLAPYQLNSELLTAARDDAIVLHCLPAHPGEEITEDLLYGDRSAVWDQAENRLHAQKALLELLVA
ncbi:MAG: ornithine carbamoyltransferase [Solirubrobacterales bacterium]